jgi:hypothetical protein
MSSRYENAQPETRVWRGQLVRGIPMRPSPTLVFNFTYHSIRDGERIDLTADRFLGDASNWWTIADVNPERLWWGDLPPGTVIRVPYV